MELRQRHVLQTSSIMPLIPAINEVSEVSQWDLLRMDTMEKEYVVRRYSIATFGMMPLPLVGYATHNTRSICFCCWLSQLMVVVGKRCFKYV